MEVAQQKLDRKEREREVGMERERNEWRGGEDKNESERSSLNFELVQLCKHSCASSKNLLGFELAGLG